MTETLNKAVPTVQWKPATEEQHKLWYPKWLGPTVHVVVEIRHGERYPGGAWYSILGPWFRVHYPHVTQENCDQLLPQGREGSRQVGRLLKEHYDQHGLRPTSPFQWIYTDFNRIRDTLHEVNDGLGIEKLDLNNDPRAKFEAHRNNPLIHAGSLDFTMPANLAPRFYEWEERTRRKATVTDIHRETMMKQVSEFLHPVNPMFLRTDKGIPNWPLIYEAFQYIRAENNGTHPDPRMGDCEAWAARNLIGSMWGILLDTEGPEDVIKWWWTFLVGRHVELIKKLVRKEIDDENGVEMTQIICHDSSILALLLALGVVDPADPRIPGFHTTLVIEVFGVIINGTRKRLLRFLLNNQPLKLGEYFQEWDPTEMAKAGIDVKKYPGEGAGLCLYGQKEFFRTERLDFAANQEKWKSIQIEWKRKIPKRAATPEPKSRDEAAGSQLAPPPEQHGDTLNPPLSAGQEGEPPRLPDDEYLKKM